MVTKSYENIDVGTKYNDVRWLFRTPKGNKKRLWKSKSFKMSTL